MTERLYYTDAYTTQFTATVVEVAGDRVYLDRTLFYPTSGGQPHDLGTLGGEPIADVVDEDDRIAHVIARPSRLSVGQQITGTVDWTRRHDHMQQHTGQHLLSAVFEDLFGHKTVSVHFGDEYATLDLDVDMLSADRTARAERRANELVMEGHLVHVSFENAATATGLRKPSDREGEIRIVEIAGIDRSACGGTHVRNTAEIGPVTIRRVEKSKKQVRVEFLCGWRGLQRARADYDALQKMAAQLTCAVDELPLLVTNVSESAKTADSERRKLAERLAVYQVREMRAAVEAAADGVVRIHDTTATVDELRARAQAASLEPRTVYAGFAGTPPTVVFAASEDSGVNAGAVLKPALATAGGRGGGSPRVAQGSVPTAALAAAVVTTILQETT
ncbi:MAG: alanine--tRNA ligase-related protein [Gemmatimonadetes bacterium]|nr:alanine--tRNA ligase-related protein [Gemmatimonadota bacterium]